MVAYWRQFLVMLLVLLQVLAPLVHAHVGEDANRQGLHLHGFEAWHIDQSDGAGLMAVNQDLQGQSAIVNIGSAIKRQQLLDQPVPVLLLLGAFFCVAVGIRDGRMVFPPHIFRFAPEPLPSQHSSRAPPY